MRFEISTRFGIKEPVDLLAVPVCQDRIMECPLVRALDGALGGGLEKIMGQEGFKGKPGQTIHLHTMGKTGPSRLAFLGLGPGEKITVERFRRAGGKAAEAMRKFRSRQAAIWCRVPENSAFKVEEAVGGMVEGARLGLYHFDKYKKDQDGLPLYAGPEKIKVTGFQLLGEASRNKAALESAAARAVLIAEGVCAARDMVNEIPEIMTPDRLAGEARELAGSLKGLKCRIMDEKQMAQAGMEAALAVARGSGREPRFIELAYEPGRVSDKSCLLGLVGKGVTFDSGGLNIKPGEHMATMKMDMSGAAAVIQAMGVMARLKLPLRVLGAVTAVENMPSGRAYKPDDVVRAFDGTTIEVGNTDAEGRLTLADSLGWAVKHGATRIVDLATLTGSCVVGLGVNTAGALGNDPDWLDTVLQAAGTSGENLCKLPLDEDMAEDIKSEIADVKNVSATRWGGVIIGALFLQKFVNQVPWVHLDIAGPAWAEKKKDYAPIGGTGFGVRTLVCLAEKLAGAAKA